MVVAANVSDDSDSAQADKADKANGADESARTGGEREVVVEGCFAICDDLH